MNSPGPAQPTAVPAGDSFPFHAWTWGVVFASFLICAAISLLYFRQQETLGRTADALEQLRLARVDLAKGFLHATLGDDPASDFNRDQGLVWLQQAVTTFEAASHWDAGIASQPGAAAPSPTEMAAAFRGDVAAFRDRLVKWTASPTRPAGLEAELRAAFHELESEADRLDAHIHSHLETLSARNRLRFVLTLGAAIVLLAGICVAMVLLGRAQRKSETALRESERRFRSTLEHVPLVAVELDAAARITYCNDLLLELTGWRHEQLIGRNWFEVFAPEAVRDSLRNSFLAAMATGNLPPHFEKEILTGAGETRLIRWSNTVRRDAHGAILGSVRLGEDITEQQRTEQAVRASEARYRTLFENNPQPMWVYELETLAFLAVNDAAVVHYGYTRAEFLAMTIADIRPAEDVPRLREAVARVQEHGMDAAGRWRHRRKDGSVIIVEINSHYLDYGGRRAELVLALDVTDREQAEAALRFANRRLEFIAQMTTAVIGTSTTAEVAERLTAQVRECFEVDACVIRIQEDKQLMLLGAAGIPADQLPARMPIVGLGQRILATRQPAVILDVRSDPLTKDLAQPAPGVFTFISFAGVPLVAEGATVGVLGLYTTQAPRAFTATDIEHLQIVANHAAVSLSNERLFKTVRTQKDQLAGLVAEREAAERALRESEERIRLALTAANQGLYDLNVQTGECIVSPEYARMLGHDPAEFHETNAAWIERLHPEDRESVAATYRDYVAGRRADYRVEFRQRTRDGDWKWILSLGKLVSRSADGQPLRMLGTHTDITERKRAEETQSRLLHILESSLNEIYVFDAESLHFEYVNGAALRNLRYTSEAMRVKTPVDLKPEFTDTSFRDTLRPLLRHETEQLTFNTVHRRSDGSRYPVEVHLQLVELPGQRVFLAVIQDITERREAEAAHARLATAVEQAAETIVITDDAGTIVYVNPAFEKATGYTRSEALGQNPRLLKSGKHDLAFYRQMWQTLIRGEVWSGHFFNKRKDGSLYEEETTISPIRDTTGRIVNYVAVKRDVTREVAMEAQLRQSQKMDAIGQLSGGVAHDFNNILAIILSNVSLTQMPGVRPEEIQDCISEIGQAATRAANLTRQLLAFSRRQTMQLAELDLNEVVANVTRMLQRIVGENIRMQMRCSPRPARIRADAGMMEQILLNLVINARDAMPRGGQLIIETSEAEFDETRASQFPQARPGHFICLSVCDNGCGIPPEILPKIFEPFFTTKEVGKGTGLGLATVYGIVQQHNGWVSVYSEVGGGTTFRVYLPHRPNTVEARPAAGATAGTLVGRETILIVEDEAQLRLLMRRILTGHGYRILEAASARAAFGVWQQHHADIRLLLTDLVMPDGMNGMELARTLLQQQPALKVIYTSGYSAEIAGREVPLQEGFNFLAKPFDAHQLTRVVRACLDAGPASPAQP